jgi:hypothetical protein
MVIGSVSRPQTEVADADADADADQVGVRPPATTRSFVIVFGALLCSRLFYWSSGLRFDDGFAGSAMQMADYDLLQRSPLSTAWYLHVQPPLFNVFVGTGAHFFGSWSTISFQVVYVFITVAMLTAFVRFCFDLGIRPWLATGLGVFLAVSPTVAQYENLLFYSHLEIALLVLGARCLQRWCREGSRPHLIGFATILSALALGRSLYHPIWFVGLVLLLAIVAISRRARRPLVLAVCVPLVFGLALGAKNAVVFGWWTTGSLEGINLHRITEPYLTEAERSELLDEGLITDISTEQFSCRDAPTRFGPAGPGWRVAVLDREHRAADARLQNLNNRHYVACLRQLRSESVNVLLHQPDAYARGVSKAAAIAMYSPVPDVRTRPGNQRALQAPGRIEGLALGSLRAPPDPFEGSFGKFLPMQTQWVLVLAAVVVPAFLGWTLVRRRDFEPAEAPVRAFMLYICLTGLVLTQLTEVGENSRLAAICWPMLLAGAGLVATTALDRAHGDRALRGDSALRGRRDERAAAPSTTRSPEAQSSGTDPT